VGITCWIICQAVINVGGVIDALPITGIPLPFISYGGSASSPRWRVPGCSSGSPGGSTLP